jgi:DNA mismatch endonuclease (patch repair protein)
MADVLTPRQRSRCMSRIRGKNTRPEIVIRKKLWSLGLRYRVNYKLPGRPDVVFVSRRLAIFIDGCFWHRCPLHYQSPATNRLFWETKITSNVQRDRDVEAQLAREGWTVLRFWEHEVKDDPDRVIQSILTQVRGQQ